MKKFLAIFFAFSILLSCTLSNNGNEESQEVVSTANFEKNNFWAVGDDFPDDATANSEFRFGTSTKHINVANEVCKSTADNPDDLVVKGSSLSIGASVGTDISGLGVANVTLADRFHEFVRPEDNTWTYGAFQTEVAGDPLEGRQ